MEIVPDSDGVEKALAALADGRTVVHATETCYGIACDVSDANAVARLFCAKKRPMSMPVSVLFSSVDQAKEYVEWNALAEKFINELPGPLTLVLPLKKSTPTQIFTTPSLLTTDYSLLTIGLRISTHPIAQELVQRFGRPLSTTSANLHGKPAPYSVEGILLQFLGVDPAPDLILDSGPLEKRSPSRVIDCTGTSPQILRA